MRYLVTNPEKSLGLTGGCTFEANIGWWTYSNKIIPQFSEVVGFNRDALYLPTLTKTGEQISSQKIESMKKLALAHGFNNFIDAEGVWISDANEIQKEKVWIAWTEFVSAKTRKLLPAIAKLIKLIANQYCVAWEDQGQLKLVG